MELTEPQKRKLLAAAEIVDKGDMAVLERLLEFEDSMQVNTDKVTETIDKVEQDFTTLKEDLTSQVENKLAEVIDGEKGEQGVDGKDGKDGRDGRDGRNGVDGTDGKDGRDGKDGVNGKDGSQDTPQDVLEKLNQSKGFISEDKIPALAELRRIANANANSLPITTSIINGYRAKNFNFVGATVSVQGDTATVTTSSGLVVTEVDGAPAVSNPTQIKFSNGSVTDNGDGTVTVTTGAGGGGDFSSNTSSSVDSELVLFSGTGGKTGKRATGTGFAKLTSGVLSVDNSTYITGNQTITLSGDVSGSGTTAITTTIGAGKVTAAMLAFSFVDSEVVSGSATTFTLANTPIVGSVHLYGGRQRLYPTTDYSITGAVITTVLSWSSGDLLCDYRK